MARGCTSMCIGIDIGVPDNEWYSTVICQSSDNNGDSQGVKVL